MNDHPKNRLAYIARACPTKKDISKQLKGRDLDEAWRIKQIQNKRFNNVETALIGNCRYGIRDGYGFRSYYMTPQPLSDYQESQIKPEFRGSVKRWPLASNFGHGFRGWTAAAIKKGWAFTWRDKNYGVSVRHTPGTVSVEGSRSASGYDTYYVTLCFDLLRQEAVWIGGLLTIRLKADAHKETYPCHWFQRRKDAPGLLVFSGNITDHNHHVEDESVVSGRKADARHKRNLQRLVSIPPKGSRWVTRQTSLDVGNCSHGTDQFIQNKLIPHFQRLGYLVGSVAGLAVQYSLVVEIDRSEFTRRLLQGVNRKTGL